MSWELLHDVVAIHRQIARTEFWKNAQFLHDDCKLWVSANELDYDAPATLARMTDFMSGGSARPTADNPA